MAGLADTGIVPRSASDDINKVKSAQRSFIQDWAKGFLGTKAEITASEDPLFDLRREAGQLQNAQTGMAILMKKKQMENEKLNMEGLAQFFDKSAQIEQEKAIGLPVDDSVLHDVVRRFPGIADDRAVQQRLFIQPIKEMAIDASITKLNEKSREFELNSAEKSLEFQQREQRLRQTEEDLVAGRAMDSYNRQLNRTVPKEIVQKQTPDGKTWTWTGVSWQHDKGGVGGLTQMNRATILKNRQTAEANAAKATNEDERNKYLKQAREWAAFENQFSAPSASTPTAVAPQPAALKAVPLPSDRSQIKAGTRYFFNKDGKIYEGTWDGQNLIP